jgi:hypothetical protein
MPPGRHERPLFTHGAGSPVFPRLNLQSGEACKCSHFIIARATAPILCEAEPIQSLTIDD